MSVIVHQVNLSTAGAHDEIMLCLLAATGKLLKHNTASGEDSRSGHTTRKPYR